MLTVKTTIHPSPIEGLGLFAAQDIPEGTIIWKYNAKFDIVYGQNELDELPEAVKINVRRYSYFCPVKNLWVLCGDDARFMNHSDTPNTSEESENISIASRNIEAGEEITCDYKKFDARSSEHHL